MSEESIIEAALAIMYVLCYEVFAGMFLKRKIKNEYVYLGMTVLWMVLMKYVTGFLEKNMEVKFAAVIGLCVIFADFLYNASIIKSIVISVIFHCIAFLVDVISILISKSAIYDDGIEGIFIRKTEMRFSLTMQFLLFFVLIFVSEIIKKNKRYMFSTVEWIRFSLFPLFSIIGCTALYINFRNINDINQINTLVYFTIGVLFANFFVFSIQKNIVENKNEIRKMALQKEKTEGLTKLYENIAKNYDEKLKHEHEFKNQIAIISELTQSGEIEKLNEYLIECNRKILHYKNVIDTNNVIVNTVLNYKYQEAAEKNIVFLVKINDLSSVKMEEMDIVTILSNLLDNAIEASIKEDVTDKIIKVKIVYENKNLFIGVTNRFNGKILKRNGRYLTIKKDKNVHGIGIDNICEIVERYNGEYVVKSSEDEFNFLINIPNAA